MSKKRKLAIDMMYHYTYRITNVKEGMYYYGVRSCDCLPKEDIGVKYFSTSKKKEFIKDQKENPQDYKYKVVKIFSTRTEAVEHEIFLHKKFEVGKNLSFYNDSKQTSTGFDRSGTKDSPETIEKKRNKIVTTETRANMSKAQLGRKHTKETIEKLKKPKTDEHKLKIGAANSGKTRTNEMKMNLSEKLSGENHPMFGKKHKPETIEKMKGKDISEETRNKLRLVNKGRIHPIVICPYCYKEGGLNAMNRYHFDNCKSKIEN